MPVAPVYFVWEVTTLLDASVGSAWPHVLNYPSWQDYSAVEAVSGVPGKEGEIVRLKLAQQGAANFPAYYARTIKLEPEKRVVWKCYPETGTTPDFIGFVELRLEHVDGQTAFTYHAIYEYLVAYQEEHELHHFRARQYVSADALFAVIFPRLKQLVENGSR